MLPAIASLIVPGLGQFVTGRYARGLSLFGLVTLMLLLVSWSVTPAQSESEVPIPFKGNPSHALWLVAVAIVWLWNVWDAARRASPPPGWIPVAAGLGMIFVIGWQVAEINPTALTANFERALQIIRPMLRPDFVQPRAEVREAWVELEVPCSEAPPAGTNTLGDLSLTLSAGCASVGDTLRVTGAGFWTDVPARLIWQSPIGDFFPMREAGSIETISTAVDAQGHLNTTFVVPKAIPPGIDPNLPQEQRLYIRQSREIGGLELSTNGGFVLQGIYESLALALMATTLGTVVAIPISFFAARNLMGANPLTLVFYVIVRTFLNIVRSIESLIIAIVFVAYIGLGPFAGMLAVMVHTVAALAKLYSEVIEGIDPGPIEAMQATGANWLQVVRYGVVPQIVPPFTAFTIYRLEINVRTATIVGLVGGGGIGFFLVQWISLSDFRAVSAAFIAILIVVTVMDFFSARIRARLA
jgi:phosphonate transport system permease protein